MLLITCYTASAPHTAVAGSKLEPFFQQLHPGHHHLSLNLLQKSPKWFSCFCSCSIEKQRGYFLKHKSEHITTLPPILQTLPITLRINSKVQGLQSRASISNLISCHSALGSLSSTPSCTGILPHLCICLIHSHRRLSHLLFPLVAMAAPLPFTWLAPCHLGKSLNVSESSSLAT